MNILPQDFVKTKCPNLWSILNRKARVNLPTGIRIFISGDEAKQGKSHLINVDSKIDYLFKRLSREEVGNSYRRDLSNVDTEAKLSQLLCEITLVAELSKLSPEKPVIRPKNSNGKSCDLKINLCSTDMYGESKRLEDTWKGGKRSIAISTDGTKPADSARPRSMDIRSKLMDTYQQFSQGAVNVIFLFHPSCWQSVMYIEQALYGDRGDAEQMRIESDGLFAPSEWNNVSGCAYVEINEQNTLSINKVWENPKAANKIPPQILNMLRELGRTGV